MTQNHTVRTPIVDVNGRNTHVYKLPEGADFDGPALELVAAANGGRGAQDATPSDWGHESDDDDDIVNNRPSHEQQMAWSRDIKAAQALVHERNTQDESRNVTYFELDGKDYDIDETDSGYAVYLDGDHVTDFEYSGDAEDHENLSDAGIRALEEVAATD